MKQFGVYRLDTRNQCLWRDSVQLNIAPRPYDVLRYLVEHPGRLIAHDELMDALWPETYVQPQVLRTYVLDLRKLLGDDAADPKFIATIRKRGYCFLAPVSGAGLARSSEMEASHGLQAPVFVGRSTAMGKLHLRLQQAGEGERQIVFLTGEAGIGKSTLLDSFCSQVGAEVRVARGQAVEQLGNRETFYLVDEMLKELCWPGAGDFERRGPEARSLDARTREARTRDVRPRSGGTSTDPQNPRRLLARLAPAWHESLMQRSSASPELDRQASESQASKAGVSTAQSARQGASTKPPETVSSVTPERTLSELCNALEAMAHDSPLLLAFEDLQWADDGTLDLLSALARRRTPARMMVIATCRPTLANDYSPPPDAASNNSPPADPIGESNGKRSSLRALRQDLAMRRLSTVIPLEPLSQASVSEYLALELRRRTGDAGAPRNDAARNGESKDGSSADDPVASDLAQFLYRESNGNPLFLSAILDHLIATRVLLARAGRWILRVPLAQLDAGLPDTLREMVELEIEALSGPDQRLAEAAAVAAGAGGGVFPVWAAAAVLVADAADVEERFELLGRRLNFLRPAGHDELPDGARSTSYVFTHHFYRDVLYSRQAGARRSRAHQRLAAALARIFAGNVAAVAAEIAGHYEAAGDWMHAAEMLAKMAEDSAARDDREDAVKLLTRGLELLENLGARERAVLSRELQARINVLTDALTDANTNATTPTTAKKIPAPPKKITAARRSDPAGAGSPGKRNQKSPRG